MKTKKREYLNILLHWEANEILLSLNNPTPYMSAIHLKLHRLALRIKGYTV